MIGLVRKNLGCLISKNVSPLCKVQASLSLSPHKFSTTAVYDVLVNKHHFSPESASVIASNLDRYRSPENADSTLSFLRQNSFTSSQLEKIVKSNPRILTEKVEDDVMLKIQTFKDFGFAPADIARMISINHAILVSSKDKKIIPQLSALKELLGSNDEVVGVVTRSTWYLTIDLEKFFVPNLEFLKSSGVTMEGIRVLLLNHPRCLLVKPDVMRRSVEKAKEMGVDRSSKMFVYAIRVLSSLKEDTLELKMQGLRDVGISESDILAVFRKSPMVFCTSLEKIKEIKKLLLATGRFDISDMVNDPTSFMASVEKRYKPRLRVLEVLESRKLIKKWPCLSTICRLSHAKFFDRYVGPYSDHLGEVCFANNVC